MRFGEANILLSRDTRVAQVTPYPYPPSPLSPPYKMYPFLNPNFSSLFRYFFKTPSDEEDCGAVYVEIMNDESPLPAYGNKIICKVKESKHLWNICSRMYSVDIKDRVNACWQVMTQGGWEEVHFCAAWRMDGRLHCQNIVLKMFSLLYKYLYFNKIIGTRPPPTYTSLFVSAFDYNDVRNWFSMSPKQWKLFTVGTYPCYQGKIESWSKTLDYM